MKKNRWLVVVNPHAGSGKCRKDWPVIQKSLEKYLVFDTVFTEYPKHAITLVRNALAEGYRKLISVGGDGTLNEVVNGIFLYHASISSEIILGVITVGTGNDWGRTHQMPSDYQEMARVINERNLVKHDVGKAKYQHALESESRYFLNIAGMGFDALVAKKVNVLKSKGYGGILVYMASLIGSLFQFNLPQVKILSHHKELYNGKAFLVAIGICRYNGGGMKLLPGADPFDGLLDVTLVKKVSKFKVAANLSKVFNGSFTKLKEVATFRGSQFVIESIPSHSLHLETDGESLGKSPILFEILPGALSIIVPNLHK